MDLQNFNKLGLIIYELERELSIQYDSAVENDEHQVAQNISRMSNDLSQLKSTFTHTQQELQ